MNYVFKTTLFFLFSSTFAFTQQMNTLSYRDTSLSYIETIPSYYNFIYPIQANIIDSIHFSPPNDGVYLKSSFGHRYLSGTIDKTDNHGGFDYWPNHISNGVTYNDTNKISIVCMCDGYISQVIHGTDSAMELLSTGRSVRVTCDSSFQTLGDKIKINYRHLSSLGLLATIADTAAFGSIYISKGDTIGVIGESGITSNVHLHLSAQTLHPIYGNTFINTARLFDPSLSPGILEPLDNARIELLHNWLDSALFRVIWPYNQTINQFQFINGADTVVFNKEDAYQTGATIRDNHDCLPRINVYAYQFNGKQTAKARYLSEMNNIPARYPASANRDTNLVLYGYSHIPITHDSISFVYDFIIKNLSQSHQAGDFVIKLSDVWGYTVEGNFNTIGTGTEPITNCDRSDLIVIYPNPTKGNIIVDLGVVHSSVDINITNSTGQLVQTRAFINSQYIKFEIEGVSGLYFVQITTTENKKVNFKILKE